MRQISKAIAGAALALMATSGASIAETRVIVRTYSATLAPTPIDLAPETATPVVATPSDGRGASPSSSGPKRYRAEPMTGTAAAAPARVLSPPPMIAAPVVAVPVVARPPAGARTYRVLRGGRLGDVAARTHTALEDIVRLNPTISLADRLAPGTIVVLP